LFAQVLVESGIVDDTALLDACWRRTDSFNRSNLTREVIDHVVRWKQDRSRSFNYGYRLGFIPNPADFIGARGRSMKLNLHAVINVHHGILGNVGVVDGRHDFEDLERIPIDV
jgi:hypothetical protein